MGSTGTVVHRCLVAGEDLVLACELSRPDAIVRWLRNGQEVQPGERVQVEARGVLRQLTINGAQPSDAGCYICDAASDRMVTNVEVSGELAQNPRDPQNDRIMPQTWARGGEASVTLWKHGREGWERCPQPYRSHWLEGDMSGLWRDMSLLCPPARGCLNLALAGSQAPLLLLWLPKAELSLDPYQLEMEGCAGWEGACCRRVTWLPSKVFWMGGYNEINGLKMAAVLPVQGVMQE